MAGDDAAVPVPMRYRVHGLIHTSSLRFINPQEGEGALTCLTCAVSNAWCIAEVVAAQAVVTCLQCMGRRP